MAYKFAYRTHEVSSGGLQIIIWSFETGDAVPEWVSWLPNRRLRVAESARSSIYRTFVSELPGPTDDFEHFQLDGRRFRCFSSSIVLPKTRKVISMFCPIFGNWSR